VKLLDGKKILEIADSIKKNESDIKERISRNKLNVFISSLFPKIRNGFLKPVYLALKFLKNYPNQIHNQDFPSWNFFTYPLKKKISFDLDWFEKRDQEEIIKFVKNRIYFSLYGDVEKDSLFDKRDLFYQKEYKRSLYSKIKKEGKGYSFKIKDKNITLPINNFESCTFFHLNGISEIPEDRQKELKGGIFIDGGGFIGDTALILNLLKPEKIYSFEPIPQNISNLRKTVSLNKMENVILVKNALGDKEETLKMNSSGSGSFIDKKGSFEVRTISLDEFKKKEKIKKISLIKLLKSQ